MTLCRHVGCRANATGCAPLPQYGIRTPVPLCPAHGGPQPQENLMPRAPKVGLSLVLRTTETPAGICRIEGCAAKTVARGLCGRHHANASDAGRLEELGLPPVEPPTVVEPLLPAESAASQEAPAEPDHDCPHNPAVSCIEPTCEGAECGQRPLVGLCAKHAAIRSIFCPACERDEACAEIARLRQAAATDGPVFERGRNEGWSDVAARLRGVLDPYDVNHWNLDGLIAEVGRLRSVAETVCPETARKVLDAIGRAHLSDASPAECWHMIADAVYAWGTKGAGMPLPAPESETVRELRDALTATGEALGKGMAERQELEAKIRGLESELAHVKRNADAWGPQLRGWVELAMDLFPDIHAEPDEWRRQIRERVEKLRQRPALTRETAESLIKAGVQVGDLWRHAEESREKADRVWIDALKAAGVTV